MLFVPFLEIHSQGLISLLLFQKGQKYEKHVSGMMLAYRHQKKFLQLPNCSLSQE